MQLGQKSLAIYTVQNPILKSLHLTKQGDGEHGQAKGTFRPSLVCFAIWVFPPNLYRRYGLSQNWMQKSYTPSWNESMFYYQESGRSQIPAYSDYLQLHRKIPCTIKEKNIKSHIELFFWSCFFYRAWSSETDCNTSSFRLHSIVKETFGLFFFIVFITFL